MNNKITNIENIKLDNGREWYYEMDQGSDILTVVVGDSWTWGDSLGKTTLEYDDREYRTSKIYGNLLAKKLESDFINVAIPGGANLYILLYLKKVLDSLCKSYKKIHIIFTLTESGRDLKNGFLHQKQHYNSWAGDSWPTFDSIINQTCTKDQLDIVLQETKGTHFEHVIGLYCATCKSKNLFDLLNKYEDYTVNCIKKIVPNIILAKNFTSIINGDLFDVKQRWTDVIAINGNLKSYPENLHVLSQMGMEPLLEFSRHLDKNEFRQEWVELFDSAQKAIDWLIESPYNSNKATKHPLELAHQWWAEHLFENVINKNQNVH